MSHNRRLSPKNRTVLDAADAALWVLESSTRRAALTYLLDHPESTRQDVIAGTGNSADAVSRALSDLVTLGYVDVSEERQGPLPDRFTAHRSEFVADLTALRDEFRTPTERTRGQRVVSVEEGKNRV